MNSKLLAVEDADVLLLVGTNPKLEAPVFNSRIMRAVKNNNLKVFLIGTPNDLTYKYVHLGVSTKVLADIAKGSHPFAERLKKAKLPMVIVGANALERKDGEGVLNAVKQITLNSPILSRDLEWNGYNILHKEGSKVGALDIGITSSPTSDFKKAKVIINMGADNNIRNEDFPEDSFVVYIGSTGDEGA